MVAEILRDGELFQFFSHFPVSYDAACKIFNSFAAEFSECLNQALDSFEIGEATDIGDSDAVIQRYFFGNLRNRESRIDNRYLSGCKFGIHEFFACLADSDDLIGRPENPFANRFVEKSGTVGYEPPVRDHITASVLEMHPFFSIGFCKNSTHEAT